MRARRLIPAGAVLATGMFLIPVAANATGNHPRESFTITSPAAGNGGGPITARGLLRAAGTDVVVNDNVDTFTFTSGVTGSITVYHSPTQDNSRFNEARCAFNLDERGVYVFANGTGGWTGYNGSGTYRASGRIAFPRNADGSCNQNAEPTGTVTVKASGPINAPDTSGGGGGNIGANGGFPPGPTAPAGS